MPTSFDRTVSARIQAMIQMGDLTASDGIEFIDWYDKLSIARCKQCKKEREKREEENGGSLSV